MEYRSELFWEQEGLIRILLGWVGLVKKIPLGAGGIVKNSFAFMYSCNRDYLCKGILMISQSTQLKVFLADNSLSHRLWVAAEVLGGWGENCVGQWAVVSQFFVLYKIKAQIFRREFSSKSVYLLLNHRSTFILKHHVQAEEGLDPETLSGLFTASCVLPWFIVQQRL